MLFFWGGGACRLPYNLILAKQWEHTKSINNEESKMHRFQEHEKEKKVIIVMVLT